MVSLSNIFLVEECCLTVLDIISWSSFDKFFKIFSASPFLILSSVNPDKSFWPCLDKPLAARVDRPVTSMTSKIPNA